MAENISLYEKIEKDFVLHEIDTRSYSPIVLAYMGDAVLEIFIRTLLVNMYSNKVSNINSKCAYYVKATTQSRVVRCFLDDDIFTEEEKAVYRRGRNANSASVAKNARLSEYKMSTGFEAVLGDLYLNKNETRLIEIIRFYIAAVEKIDSEK